MLSAHPPPPIPQDSGKVAAFSENKCQVGALVATRGALAVGLEDRVVPTDSVAGVQEQWSEEMNFPDILYSDMFSPMPNTGEA